MSWSRRVERARGDLSAYPRGSPAGRRPPPVLAVLLAGARSTASGRHGGRARPRARAEPDERRTLDAGPLRARPAAPVRRGARRTGNRSPGGSRQSVRASSGRTLAPGRGAAAAAAVRGGRVRPGPARGASRPQGRRAAAAPPGRRLRVPAPGLAAHAPGGRLPAGAAGAGLATQALGEVVKRAPANTEARLRLGVSLCTPWPARRRREGASSRCCGGRPDQPQAEYYLGRGAARAEARRGGQEPPGAGAGPRRALRRLHGRARPARVPERRRPAVRVLAGEGEGARPGGRRDEPGRTGCSRTGPAAYARRSSTCRGWSSVRRASPRRSTSSRIAYQRAETPRRRASTGRSTTG